MNANALNRWVEISFDCLPLRSVARLDLPLDADEEMTAKVGRIRAALAQHGTHNTYFLHNASCVFHFTNDPGIGMVEFRFEGVIVTCKQDLTAAAAHLSVNLAREACSWLNQAVVDWLRQTVREAVMVEFNRFAGAGDLAATRKRLAALESAINDQEGYVGMYL